MFRRKSKERNYFISNGAAVLEQIIRNFNGNCNPIRSYSTEELKNATNHFQSEIHRDGRYSTHQGILQNREIAVKKFNPKFDGLEVVAKDLAISSRMSSHKNVLKLLGCCLETELPIMVYEFPENGNLSDRLFNRQAQEKLSWDQKLTIVIKIANSITYLHHGLPNTFIHRDLKPGNIYLDGDLCPKLFDFQWALQIPEGKTHIDADISGTLGYMDPDAYETARYTSKSDVYGFGALLFEVLTEKRIYELPSFESPRSKNQLLDEFVKETVEERCKEYMEDERIRVQVKEYVRLVKRCLGRKQEDRPDMIQAEKELRRIKNL